jgi:hypothetical protein
MYRNIVWHTVRKKQCTCSFLYHKINQQMHINKICFMAYYSPTYFASATIILVSYKSTNNMQIIAGNIQLKPHGAAETTETCRWVMMGYYIG